MSRVVAMPPVVLALYAAPAFALAVPTIPVYILLPGVYAETLGLGLAATGVALFAARLLDVITDPIIGLYSDRLRTRWGRRRPFIAVGAVIAAIALVRLLDPPPDPGIPYLVLWAGLLYFGWTLVAVPYTAWAAELSPGYHERARITGAREAALLLGVLASAAMPAIVSGLGGSQRDGLAATAWLAIAVGVPTLAALLLRIPEGAVTSTHKPNFDRSARRSILANKPFIRLMLAWFVNGLANGFPAVLFPLYITHVLGANEIQRAVLIAIYFCSAVAAIPVWVWLSRRLEKHRTWCWAMLLACAAFVWVPWIPDGALVWFAVICILTGAGLGADLALPPAMQADVVDLDRWRTGEQRAGLFFALWSMASKLALAAAVGIAFPLLDLTGFDPAGIEAPQSKLTLVVIYSIVPVVLKAFAIAIIWRHRLTETSQRAIQRRLERRSKDEEF